MAHYAKIINGVVAQVIVAETDFFKTFIDSFPGEWIQTSYNTRGGIHYGQDNKPDNGVALRANYAGVGYIYDATNDVFHAPRPIDCNGLSCTSWTIAEPTWIWNPPIEMPTDGKQYVWDEPTKTWIAQ